MITVIGSINMDMSVMTAEIPKTGETVVGTRFLRNFGGKGANQAVAAARMGSEVAFIGAVGNDPIGKELLENLTCEGVDTSFVKTADEPSGVALIEIDGRGRNSIVVAPGSNHALRKEDIDQAEETIRSSGYMVIQFELLRETVEYAIQKAKKLGCVTVFNPSPVSEIDASVYEYTDILVPNEYELSRLTGMKTETAEECRKASFVLLEKGVKNVVCTRGGEGVTLTSDGVYESFPAEKATAVDTSGAGDAFLGGFVHALDSGCDMKEAVAFGQRVAAYSIQRMGTQLSYPKRSEIL